MTVVIFKDSETGQVGGVFVFGGAPDQNEGAEEGVGRLVQRKDKLSKKRLAEFLSFLDSEVFLIVIRMLRARKS